MAIIFRVSTGRSRMLSESIRKRAGPFCLPIGTTKRTTGSTMPSHDPKPGEIWLAYVEFLDHPGIGKVRPAF